MADLSITAADVQQSAAAEKRTAVSAEAIAAGQTVYKTAAGLVALADANVTALTAASVGIAINSCGAGQPVSYAVKDSAFIAGAGTNIVIGEAYVVSAAAGGLAPIADLASDDYVTLIGIGTSTSTIWLEPIATGAQHA